MIRIALPFWMGYLLFSTPVKVDWCQDLGLGIVLVWNTRLDPCILSVFITKGVY